MNGTVMWVDVLAQATQASQIFFFFNEGSAVYINCILSPALNSTDFNCDVIMFQP